MTNFSFVWNGTQMISIIRKRHRSHPVPMCTLSFCDLAFEPYRRIECQSQPVCAFSGHWPVGTARWRRATARHSNGRPPWVRKLIEINTIALAARDVRPPITAHRRLLPRYSDRAARALTSCARLESPVIVEHDVSLT